MGLDARCRSVRIVASCTLRKRLPVAPDFCLRSLADRQFSERLSAWGERLYGHKGNTLEAADLYCGGHWAVVRELSKVAEESGFQAGLWVASAGYGLIAATQRISSYSATFSSQEADSVWRASDGNRQAISQSWWDGLQSLPLAAGTRSIGVLSAEAPGAPIMVIASPLYLAAMARDLADARTQLSDPSLLILISSQSPILPSWMLPHLISADMRLSGLLGGSLGSLHARTARRILREADAVPIRADVLGPRFERLASSEGRVETPKRQRLSDREVRDFILAATATSASGSCSATLRSLRLSGQACEQRRFTRLYADVEGSRCLA